MTFTKSEYESIIKSLLYEITKLHSMLDDKVDLGVLDVRSEMSRLKRFMEVFNELSYHYADNVQEHELISKLVETGRFDEREAREYTKKAMANGQIYERSSGILAKA